MRDGAADGDDLFWLDNAARQLVLRLFAMVGGGWIWLREAGMLDRNSREREEAVLR